jgi:CBS domain-containing protein
MAQHVPTCAPADPLNEVMVIMTHSRHRHLPVLVDGELAGLISIGDVVRARLDEMELETGVLRDLYAARH